MKRMLLLANLIAALLVLSATPTTALLTTTPNAIGIDASTVSSAYAAAAAQAIEVQDAIDHRVAEPPEDPLPQQVCQASPPIDEEIPGQELSSPPVSTPPVETDDTDTPGFSSPPTADRSTPPVDHEGGPGITFDGEDVIRVPPIHIPGQTVPGLPAGLVTVPGLHVPGQTLVPTQTVPARTLLETEPTPVERPGHVVCIDF
ncbi:MAG: hypothetical protein ACPGQL_05725 [Thermoplasmatota archaeon]